MQPAGESDPAASGLERILACFPEESRRQPIVRSLAGRLDALSRAGRVGERLDAWMDLVEWTRDDRARLRTTRTSAPLPEAATERLRLLLSLFEGAPELRSIVFDSMGAMLAESEGAALFGETGVPSHRGFFSELGDRVMDRLLPVPRDDHDLTRLVHRLFPARAHVRRVESLDPDLFHRIVAAMAPEDRAALWQPIREAFADGFRLLSARVAAEGLSSPLRRVAKTARVSESAFYRLGTASEAILAEWSPSEGCPGAAGEWRRVATDCWAEMGHVRGRLDAEGISVDIVYAIDVIGRSLRRMESMVAIMEAPRGPRRSAAIQSLVAGLAGMHLADRSVTHLAAANLRLLARKIVDRSGKTGEHYIARDRKEYGHLWLAAAGGGLLTVLTAAVKMRVVGRGLPAFPEGFLSGVNYAVSFLLLQTFGLVLATKQPAMTAATLAAILRDRRGSHRLDEIVDYTAAIVRSQVAAAISNVAAVAVGCVLFDRLWRLASGHPYLNHHDAEHVFRTLSPLDSLTVLYAAETGVLLWLASVAGGWFENWALYRRLPRIVAEHPLGGRLGRERLRRFSEALARNASGWGTNVSLGFLLGMTPALGRFFGLPLDVRHVTLSTGTLALAAASLDTDGPLNGAIFRGAAGIAVMFVLNLSVSFVLSLASAARAYGLPGRDVATLFRRLVRRFVTRPGQFLLPPRTSEPAGGERTAHA